MYSHSLFVESGFSDIGLFSENTNSLCCVPTHLQLDWHGPLGDSRPEWCSDLLRLNDGLMNRGIFGAFVRWNFTSGIDGHDAGSSRACGQQTAGSVASYRLPTVDSGEGVLMTCSGLTGIHGLASSECVLSSSSESASPSSALALRSENLFFKAIGC